jgi:glycosyltransferase involved in cell wall biosynthesis
MSDRVGPSINREDRLFPDPLRRWIASVTTDPAWENRLLAHMIARSGNSKILHVVAGDNDTWVYKKRPFWLRTKITATFHQPVDRLGAFVDGLRAGMLDGAVCVSRDQVPMLAHLVPEGRCVFVPHGVDTDFFGKHSSGQPTRNDRAPLLLAVGAHRRDLITLVGAARIIKHARPEVRIKLIGPSDRIAYAASSGVIETASNVSDVELRDAYHECTMLFLPLEAATANNALLESMAAGRPAVISDFPGIHDYSNAAATVFCKPGDAQAHASEALSLLSDVGRRESMGRVSQEIVQQFSWPRVHSELIHFMLKLASDS